MSGVRGSPSRESRISQRATRTATTKAQILAIRIGKPALTRAFSGQGLRPPPEPRLAGSRVRALRAARCPARTRRPAGPRNRPGSCGHVLESHRQASYRRSAAATCCSCKSVHSYTTSEPEFRELLPMRTASLRRARKSSNRTQPAFNPVESAISLWLALHIGQPEQLAFTIFSSRKPAAPRFSGLGGEPKKPPRELDRARSLLYDDANCLRSSNPRRRMPRNSSHPRRQCLERVF